MESWITADSRVCHGKPTIRGTRIMVRNILGMLAGGYDIDRILKEYPDLTREAVIAAIEYAGEVIDQETVISHV